MFYTIQSHNLQMLRKYANYIGLHLRDFPGDYPRSAPVTFFIGPFSFPLASPFALRAWLNKRVLCRLGSLRFLSLL